MVTEEARPRDGHAHPPKHGTASVRTNNTRAGLLLVPHALPRGCDRTACKPRA